jgi:hypothetical protein
MLTPRAFFGEPETFRLCAEGVPFQGKSLPGTVPLAIKVFPIPDNRRSGPVVAWLCAMNLLRQGIGEDADVPVPILVKDALGRSTANTRWSLPSSTMAAGERVCRELLKRAEYTTLRRPTGISCAQGVKANVLFF